MNHKEDFDDVVDFLSFDDLTPTTRRAGTVIDDFRLIREIGRGGGGVVFEAVQRSLGRHVALKFLHDQSLGQDAADIIGATVSPDQGALESLRKEAVLLASLEHPHLVKVYAVGVDQQQFWVAMQLIDGHPLDALLKAPLASFPKAGERDWLSFLLPLLADVADALSVVHKAGISHGDIKPSNVLVDLEGQAFLTDFGLADNSPEGKHDGDHPGDFRGTPRFASPEQARGEHASARSDVFSFGLLMYSMINRGPAFAGQSTKETLHLIQNGVLRWLRKDQVPRDLRAIIEKCVEKAPLDRYAHGGEIAEELHRFLRFEPVLAHPHGRLFRWARLLRHRPKLAMGLAALVLVSLLAIWAIQKNDGTQQDLHQLGDESLVAELEEAWIDDINPHLWQQQEFQEALGRYAPAAILNGDARFVDKDYPGAQKMYRLAASQTASELNPMLQIRLDLVAWHLEGQPLSALDLAEDDFVITNAPDSYLLSHYLWERGEQVLAMQASRKGIHLVPHCYPLLKARGHWAMERLGHRAAVASFEATTTLHPQDYDDIHALTLEYIARNRLVDAAMLTRRVLAVRSDLQLVQADNALVKLLRYDPSADKQARKAFHASKGESVWISAVFIRVLAKSRKQFPLDELTKAFERHGENGYLLEVQGLIAVDRHDWDTAQQASEKLIALEKKNLAGQRPGNPSASCTNSEKVGGCRRSLPTTAGLGNGQPDLAVATGTDLPCHGRRSRYRRVARESQKSGC